MSGTGHSIDVAAFGDAWDSAWPDCPPVAHRLRRQCPGRWARFHTLPHAKRYATTPAEEAEILRRHRALLTALGEGSLVAITCSWSATAQPTPRHTTVAATTPGAAYWRSDDLAYEPGFHSWQHHYISPTSLNDPALDRLLRCVADDMTDGVILTDDTGTWAAHPYDGGTDVFTATAEGRDQLAAAYPDWLASVSR
jgi:hypothetical protein